MDETDWLIEETVEFTTRVKTKYWDRSAVIIDLLSKQIKKNRYTEKSNDEVIAYFYGKYRDQIKKFIIEYMMVHGRQPEISSTNDEATSVNT